MKAYAMVRETFLRKRSIRLVHLSWLGTYALIFLIPFPPETWHWGAFLFGWSGCLLPLLLSEGILGDDIASGRICLLVTEPIRPVELYGYRLLGLSLQGAAHLLAVGALILLLHQLTGRGSVDHLVPWMLATWLIFNTWTALSTSLSVVLRRAHNSMLLFIVTVAAFFVVSTLQALFPKSGAAQVLLGALRYVGPPVELLAKVGLGQCSLWRGFANISHSLLLTALYGTAGIILLGRREFMAARD